MTITNIEVKYCSCGRLKIYIAFKPNTKIKLKCTDCDKPKES